MTRVLVCGGRNYGTPPQGAIPEELKKATIERAELNSFLDDLLFELGTFSMCHGGASGADTLAGEWAHRNKIEVKVYPADWNEYGKAAGPIRNQIMLADFDPDMIIAFPGGRGTAHMMNIARKAKKEVRLAATGITLLGTDK